MERKEWLKSLREGDEVWNSRQRGYNFYTIKKITPTGKIRLNNDVLLNENGHGESGYRFNMTYYEIEPITQEILDDIRQRKEKSIATKELKETINNLKIDSLSIEEIQELNKILKEFNNKE